MNTTATLKSTERFVRQLVSTRFEGREKSYLTLNERQENARREVIAKIASGAYQFFARNCQLCGANDFIVVGERDRYSLPVQTVICKSCSLLMTNPAMREIDYVDFYQKHYTALYDGFQYSPAEFFENQKFAGKRLYDTISRHVDLRDKTVAEVGCAAGGILFFLQSHCRRVVGCDYGSRYMDEGVARGLNLKIGPLSSIRDEKPDVIIYSHVLEHILDINKELQEVAAILPENGLLIIDVPGLYNIENAYESDFLKYLQNAHLFHFTGKSLGNMMARHGFKTIHVDERCIGLFQKADIGGVDKFDPDEHLRIRNFLVRIERFRFITKIKLMPRKVLVKILKATGVHDIVRHLYRRATSK